MALLRLGQVLLGQTFSPSPGFETVALKCKHNCKKHKKKKQQNNNGPGQIPDNTQQTPDNPKPKPKHNKNNPKGGNHPPVVVFKPVIRPGGICIDGRIIKQRCRCQANEVRNVIGKGIFACRKNETTAQATPASSNATVAAASPAGNAPGAEFAPNEVLLTFPLNNAQQIEDQVAVTL